MKTAWTMNFIVLFATTASAWQVDTLYYKIIEEDREEVVEWIITPIGRGFQEIRSFNPESGVNQFITCDSTFATIRWLYDNPKRLTHLSVQRIDDTLHFSGLMEGKNKQWAEKIGSKPWFQFPGLAMARFARQGKKQIIFHSIKADNGKIYKLKARKQSKEMIQYQEESVSAQKVTVSLKGFLSAFGKVHFWVCSKTSRFLKYEGFSGVLAREPQTYQLIDFRRTKQPAQELTMQTINRSE